MKRERNIGINAGFFKAYLSGDGIGLMQHNDMWIQHNYIKK